MEGNGISDKGLKVEWATVKDGLLHLGSIGKEFMTPNSQDTNLCWIGTMDQHLSIHHLDWNHRYQKMREATGTAFPGYLIHEAMQWSDVHRRWFALPRRVSAEPYDEILDESRGSDVMIIADEFFENLEVRHVGPAVEPTHGFSSFKFVPDTNDESEENAEAGTQNSYLTVFTSTGEVLMEEVMVPGNYKYEGVEFF
uniref:Apyrase n=1 Tax=Phaeomonas parva TaxID=124430 RepID=A0A7S1U9J8_9STRA